MFSTKHFFTQDLRNASLTKLKKETKAPTPRVRQRQNRAK